MSEGLTITIERIVEVYEGSFWEVYSQQWLMISAAVSAPRSLLIFSPSASAAAKTCGLNAEVIAPDKASAVNRFWGTGLGPTPSSNARRPQAN